MRVLASVVLAGALLAGCSESSTDQSAANASGSNAESSQSDSTDTTDTGQGSGTSDGNNGANSNTGDDNTDSGQSSSGTGSGSSDNATTDTGDSNTGITDNGGTTTEPAPVVVRFTGEDFNYLPISANYIPADYPSNQDPRKTYTIWAETYVKAQALLEAMHAINYYRDENQQIKTVNGGAENLGSLIADYCPSSGDDWAPQRCAFYAQLAHAKTTAQDGWQAEHRLNNDVPMMCGNIYLKFIDCYYSVTGAVGLFSSSNGFHPGIKHVNTTSPIEGWHYENNWQKITEINAAAQSFFHCTYSGLTAEDDNALSSVRGYPVISLWPLKFDFDTLPAFTAWDLVPDVYEDVHRDTTALHPRKAGCPEQFAADLKAIEPAANL